MLGLPVRLLDESTLTVAASSKTFTLSDYTIPSGSRHLVLIYDAASADAVTERDVNVTFNADTGTNYNDQFLKGSSSTTSAARTNGQAALTIGLIPGSSVHASAMGGGHLLIPHYANTANHKAVLSLCGSAETSVQLAIGRWAATAAITSITMTPSAGNFLAGSYFAIGVVDERYAVEEKLLSSDTTSFTFSTLPALQGDLIAVGYIQTDNASVGDNVNVALNADTTTTNYNSQRIVGEAGYQTATLANTFLMATTTGENATNQFTSFLFHISQHNRGVNDPHMIALSGYHVSSPKAEVWALSGRRNNVAAVTSIAFTPLTGSNFKDGSIMSLYYVPKKLFYRYLESGGGSAKITTPTIPSGYAAIEICVYARSEEAVTEDEIEIEINADETAANFDVQELQGDSSTMAASQSAADRQIGIVPGGSATANVLGGGILTIPRYDQTDRHKHILAITGWPEGEIHIRSMRWENTAAITSITFDLNGGDQFADGTVIEVWLVVDKDNEPDLQGTRATKAVVTPS